MQKLINELTILIGLLTLIVQIVIPYLIMIVVLIIGFYQLLKLEFYLIDTYLR